MKIVSTTIHQHQKLQSVAREKLIPAVTASLRETIALMVAVVAAIVIITLTVWMAGLGINTYLGASTWGIGFIFLALAVDNRGRIALFQMASGVVLLVLALLQNSVSADFIIVAGILLAIWLAVVVFKRLSI